jgi:hypothetical protein
MAKSFIRYSVLWLLLWWPTIAFGNADSYSIWHPPEPGSVSVEYEGVIICARCDLSPSPENRARCQTEGHLPLLRRTDGQVSTLVGGTNTTTAKLVSEALHDKKVRITGIYLSKSNQIIVETVTILN